MEKKKYITIVNEMGLTEIVEFGSDRFITIEYAKNKIAHLEKQLEEYKATIKQLIDYCEEVRKQYETNDQTKE